MITESEKLSSYIITIPADQTDENGNPVFSFGKLLHVVQNVCSNYSDSFCIREETEYVYESETFHREDFVLVTLTGIPESEVNDIALDLCAFLNLNEVKIRKTECEHYSVSDSI